MAAATSNPLVDPASWSKYTIGGVRSPGTIPKSGMSGFVRETGWDKKVPKGAAAPTLTRTTAPPCEGSITNQLITKDELDAWPLFIAVLLTPPAKGAAGAFAIYHPSFADIKLSSVVVAKIHPIVHLGRGMYHGTIEFIEWVQPVAKNIVTTPTKAAPNGANTLPGAPPDPVGDALEAKLLEQLKRAQGL